MSKYIKPKNLKKAKEAKKEATRKSERRQNEKQIYSSNQPEAERGSRGTKS